MKKLNIVLCVIIAISLLLSGCAGGTANDKLQEVKDRGVLIISTDPAYPPQSELVEGAKRPADTKCTGEQVTANELQGFDIDVAKEIAKRMKVELCFVTPAWDLIVGGNWANRWDMSVGSVTITQSRMEKLYFSQPYYTTPAAFFVNIDNTSYTQPSDLSGKKIGACSACTYDAYLTGQLVIPGVTIDVVVQNPDFKGYETDVFALQDLALGDGVRLDAVLTAEPTGQGAIKDGLAIKQLGEPVFFEYLAAAVDKAADKDPIPLIKEVTKIIQAMHEDGTLKALSEKWYGVDLASPAATFNVDDLKQFP